MLPCHISWIYRVLYWTQNYVITHTNIHIKHLVNPSLDGRIILRWIFRKWNVGSMAWNELAQDRDRWQAVVNAVMNLLVL